MARKAKMCIRDLGNRFVRKHLPVPQRDAILSKKEALRMLNWIHENLGTILVSLVLILALTLAVWKLIRDRKAGRHSCGGCCEGCALRGRCQDQTSQPER